jgi:cytoskeletal protein RodZ
MTLRTCPKCSAYYEDELLAFCLVDGMPLIGVAPGSESWSKGTRVIEEKTKASIKQQRRLKWRRIVLSAMTTLMLTMVVARSFTVEIIPAKTVPALAAAPSPSPSPAFSALLTTSESPSPTKAEDTSPIKTESTSLGKTDNTSPAKTEDTSPSKTEDTSPTKTEDTSPTEDESPTKTETLLPTPIYKISGRVIYSGQPLGGVKITLEGSKLTSTTTDANGNYTFSDLRAGGDYTITPKAKVELTPPNRSFNNLTHDESANFSGVGKVDSPVPQGCSDDDKRNESNAISDRLSAGWRRKIANERAGVIAESVPDGMKGEVRPTEIEYHSAFPRGCKMAVVTLTYDWLISMSSPTAPAKTLRLPKNKVFPCYKVFGLWTCSY